MGISSGIGLASGINIDAIVNATINVERAPVFDLRKKEADFQAKISTYGNIKGLMNTLQTAAEALSEEDSFKTGFTAKSADTDVIKVTTDDKVAAGSYDINVLNLASSAQINSKSYTATDTEVGTGTIQLQLGDGNVVDIAIDNKNDNNTLEGIAKLINNSDAEVTASVIKKDTDNYILSLTGKKTGRDIAYSFQEDGFTFTTKTQATEDKGGVMASEAYDSDSTALNLAGDVSIAGMSSISITATDTLNDIQAKIDGISGVTAAVVEDASSGKFSLEITHDTKNKSAALTFDSTATTTEFANLRDTTTAAVKAQLEVNGVTIFREDNKIEDLSEGLTLELNKDSEGKTIKVSVDANYNNAASKIETFVSSYNSFTNTLEKLQKYDKDKKVGGILMGDATANGIRNGSRSILFNTVEGVNEKVDNLSKLGISVEKTGTIKFDKEVFIKAMEDNTLRGEVIKFFTSTTSGDEGFGTKFNKFAESYTDSREGILVGKENSFKSQVKRINTDVAAKERRLTMREKNLRSQFLNLEQLLSTFNSTRSYLTNQLSALDNMTKSFANRR